jgi:hypothetical protein
METAMAGIDLVITQESTRKDRVEDVWIMNWIVTPLFRVGQRKEPNHGRPEP